MVKVRKMEYFVLVMLCIDKVEHAKYRSQKKLPLTIIVKDSSSGITVLHNLKHLTRNLYDFKMK